LFFVPDMVEGWDFLLAPAVLWTWGKRPNDIPEPS
jgi:hypothetical protein